MKLRKEHFVKLEKPIEDDFMVSSVSNGRLPEFEDAYFEEGEYNKALKEWERKYIKPTPKWKKFSDEKPNNGQEIFISDYDELTMCNIYDYEWLNCYFDRSLLDSSDIYNYYESISDHWASVEDYKESLSYYNDRKALFENWKEVADTGGNIFFIKNGVQTHISNLRFKVVDKSGRVLYDGKNGPNAVEILKLICKDNDIEL